MPALPTTSTVLPLKVEITPSSSYERIAVAIRDDVYDDKIRVGMPIPSVK